MKAKALSLGFFLSLALDKFNALGYNKSCKQINQLESKGMNT